ncbi:MAG: NHL repeat containing protein, partial [Candidatus Magnetoglobus multicellularis str. Araruama]
TLISNGNGSFAWADVESVFTTEANNHTVLTGNVGIGTTSPTEQLEVDGNVKLTNGLILATGSSSVSQTTLKAMTQSEARTITLPDASGVVIVTDDGTITVPDGSITASKLANNPGNGPSGQTLVSNGDGTFDWGGFVTTQGHDSASLAFSITGSEIGSFDAIHGIAIDSKDNIYVSDLNNNRIQVFTSSGDYSYSLGTGFDGSGTDDINGPAGIAIDSDDNIYIAEKEGNRIHGFNAQGTTILNMTNDFSGPYGIAVDNDGTNMYVADTSNDIVKICTCPFACNCNEIGDFRLPYGIALGSNGNIFVADTMNKCIRIYDNDTLIDTIGSEGSGPGEFSNPRGVDVDSDGLIYVADTLNSRIQVFTASGDYSYSICGGFSWPNCVKVHKNKIYVGDDYGRILVFNKPVPTTHTVETGNVGIATTSPSDTLDVSGTF